MARRQATAVDFSAIQECNDTARMLLPAARYARSALPGGDRAARPLAAAAQLPATEVRKECAAATEGRPGKLFLNCLRNLTPLARRRSVFSITCVTTSVVLHARLTSRPAATASGGAC